MRKPIHLKQHDNPKPLPKVRRVDWVMTDSVWTKRECPRTSDRVDKLMENA